jgi:transcriptional regulator with GAF, ATPase, and Fis domain
MSSHTGASALLALISAPRTIALDAAMSARRGLGGAPPDDPHGPAARARQALRGALRRLLRASGGSVRAAARALGVSAASLRAAAAQVGIGDDEIAARRESRT